MAAPDMATDARAASRIALYFQCMFSSCCYVPVSPGRTAARTWFLGHALSAVGEEIRTVSVARFSVSVGLNAAGRLHDRLLSVKRGKFRQRCNRTLGRDGRRCGDRKFRGEAPGPLAESWSAAGQREGGGLQRRGGPGATGRGSSKRAVRMAREPDWPRLHFGRSAGRLSRLQRQEACFSLPP